MTTAKLLGALTMATLGDIRERPHPAEPPEPRDDRCYRDDEAGDEGFGETVATQLAVIPLLGIRRSSDSGEHE